MDAVKEARESAREKARTVECPEPFRGPMSMMVETSLRYQNRRQPELTVAAALSAMSACMHGQISLPDGLRGNLYVIGLAGSGAGKNGPLNLIKTVAALIGDETDDVITNVGSGQAVEDALRDKGRATLVIDEVAHLIGAFSKGGSHMGFAEKLLLEAYSASSSYITTRALVSRAACKIPFPYLSLFGTTTFASMAGLSASLIENGMLGRCLLVSGQDFAPLSITEYGHMSSELDACIGAVARSVANCAGVVRVTGGAIQFERDASANIDGKAQRADGTRRTLLMRTVEQAKRVALVLATWDDIQAVTPEHLEWAFRFVAYCQSCLLRYVDGMTDSQAVRDAARIEAIMRDAVDGRAPFKTTKHTAYNDIAASKGLVGHSALLKASRLPKAAFEACVAYLHDVGTVTVEDIARYGRGGPGSERYYRLRQ